MRLFSLMLAFVALFALPALAESAITVSGVSAMDYARKASVGAATPMAVHMTIHNAATTSDYLTRVEVRGAARAELHTMDMTGGVMRMRRTSRFEIPAGGDKVLGGNGDHIMLMGVRRPIDGGVIPLKLVFKNGGTVDVTVQVEEKGLRPDVQKAMDHMDMNHMDMGQ